MANRAPRGDPATLNTPQMSPSHLRAGLDTLDFGFAIFDRNLKLVACNTAFRMLRGYPAAMCKPGAGLVEFYRFNARRGDYGPGDAELHAEVAPEPGPRATFPTSSNMHLPSGQILNVRYTPITHGGLVLAYADITARKRAELALAQKEAELHVALDNMPGALAYTDVELDIVICNDRFADMYPRTAGTFSSAGRHYPDFLRYLAEHGYYGDGDVDALVARRVESLRNPSGETFEDRPPDGRDLRGPAPPRSAGGHDHRDHRHHALKQSRGTAG